MNTAVNINQLAELLNGKVWSKNGYNRIYIQDFRSTGKTEIKVWVEIEEKDIYVNAWVNCPSQSRAWNENYKNQILDLVDSRLKNALAKLNQQKQTILTSKSEVMRYAWGLIKGQGLSRSEALKAAWALYKRG